MSSETKRKVGDALELVGTFLFGSDRAIKKKVDKIAKDVDDQVARARARRRITPGDPDAIDVEGEEVDDDGE
jgi:hypothetical protein